MARTVRRQSYVRLMLACLVLVPLSWALIGKAQERNVPHDAGQTSAPAMVDDLLIAALQRESALEEQRHQERLTQFRLLKDGLARMDSEEARRESARLDELIAEEERDFAARRSTLQDLVAAGLRTVPTLFQDEKNENGEDNENLEGLIRNVRRINQSYAVSPVVSPSAWTGGSYFVDVNESELLRRENARIEAPAGDDDADKSDVVRLPAPLYVGPGYIGRVSSDNLEALRWLYGDLPADYRVEIDKNLFFPGVLPLRERIDRLSRHLEELRKQLEEQESRKPESQPE